MMLIAATQQVRETVPGAIISIAPDDTHSYEAYARLGLWHRAELIRGGIDLGAAMDFVPARLRRRYGFVTGKETNVILDAAGLAYSDQWSLSHTQDLARRAQSWKARGKKLILLPQAFGPFGTTDFRDAIRRAADCADLIFARDAISYRHLVEAVGERPTICKAPDFTNLLQPAPRGDAFSKYEHPVAIVPNTRMLDKTGQRDAFGYLSAMRHAVAAVREAGLDPFLLIHEGPMDKKLGDEINAGLSVPMDVLWPDDPLVAKGILGGCTAVVASRFHALVSALAQGVPSLGTSWNHKYQELFADYDCPECLLPISEGADAVAQKLHLLTDAATRAVLKSRIEGRSEALKDDTRAMWQQVFSVL